MNTTLAELDAPGTAEARPGHHPAAVSPESSVSKALSLLITLAGSPHGVLGVSELALASGLPKSTAHRLLRELQAHNLVDRHGTRYRVGNGLMSLNAAVRRSSHGQLRDAAQNVLAWLYDRTHLTVHLAVLDHAQVLYIEKLTGRDGMRIPSRVGDTMPLTCTALGKALLAFSTPALITATLSAPLPRRTRYSILNRKILIDQLTNARTTHLTYDREESALGIACISTPILTSGHATAAISLAGPPAYLTTPTITRDLHTAAQHIASAVAGFAAYAR
jgi:DNA-binding IclR family transcriptional regulator